MILNNPQRPIRPITRVSLSVLLVAFVFVDEKVCAEVIARVTVLVGVDVIVGVSTEVVDDGLVGIGGFVG